jgi:hypothetical protein
MYSNLDNKEYIDKLYSKESLTDEYTADMRFLQRIQNQVTINGQLPFNVPIDNIPEIIYNSVEWYFRHCEDASEEKWMLLPVSALHVDGNYNSEIKLPFRIISVNEVNAVDSSRAFSMMPYNRRNALRYETMLMTASSYSTLNVGGYAINAVGALYTNRFYDNVADSMMIMNLQGAINSAFSKHYRYKYNRNSRVLRFLTDYILNQWKNAGRITGKEFIGSTIVTSDVFFDLAEQYGVDCKAGLTGFKWIGKMIRDAEGVEKFVCGGEESFGFMTGDFVRDKDSCGSTSWLVRVCSNNVAPSSGR